MSHSTTVVVMWALLYIFIVSMAFAMFFGERVQKWIERRREYKAQVRSVAPRVRALEIKAEELESWLMGHRARLNDLEMQTLDIAARLVSIERIQKSHGDVIFKQWVGPIAGRAGKTIKSAKLLTKRKKKAA